MKIRMISSGRDHTICADEEGKVYAWGFNGYGQLGIGNNKIQLSPVPVPFFHNTQKPKPANIPSFMWRPRPLMRVKYISCGSMCCNVIDKSQSALYVFFTVSSILNRSCVSAKSNQIILTTQILLGYSQSKQRSEIDSRSCGRCSGMENKKRCLRSILHNIVCRVCL